MNNTTCDMHDTHNICNYKNIIQTHLSQLGIPPPIYNTRRVDGTDHSPVFVSEVTVLNQRYVSDRKANKKTAELDVAKKVLTAHNNFIPDPTLLTTKSNSLLPLDLIKTNTYIYIDVENIQTCCDDLSNMFDYDPSNVICCLSTSHALASRSYKGTKVLFPSDRKDACDIGMIMHITILLEHSEVDRIIIVTQDHFAGALRDLLVVQYDIVVHHVTTSTACCNLLREGIR